MRSVGSLISDDLPNAPLAEAAVTLVDRASKRGKQDDLVAALRKDFRHVLELPA